MARFIRLAALALASLALLSASLLAQSGTVTGRVSDASSGEDLIGGNIRVVAPGTTTMPRVNAGASSGLNGSFTIPDIPAGTYELLVTFVGFDETRVPITVVAGQTVTQNVALEPEGVNLNAVVVTASRSAEKVLDAPAAVSVISAKEIEETPTSSAAVLRNTPGVDFAQTGVDRYEIVLRGFNNAFSGSAHTLTDYRQANVPSLNVNAYSMMPISNIDLEKVEVVRGPGSALYGAGVDAGVVHFFTKNPFYSPGTTVALTAGERGLVSGNLRHAGVLGERFGYKVAGTYSQARDWEMDPNDPEDAAQLSTDSRDRIYDSDRVNVNGMLEYRIDPKTSVIFNTGYSRSSNTFLSGIGTLQAVDFAYTYFQGRLQAGNLFAQAYFNRNDEGDSFIYNTGQAVIDNSTLLSAQAQYAFEFGANNSGAVVGVDMDITTPDTDGTIYGRNEADAQISEYGAYAQGTFSLGSKLDLTAAARFDINNIRDGARFSPRAALVFKPSIANSFRLTYNRAFSSPGNNSLFLDIVANQGQLAPPLPFYVTLMGSGSAKGFTFNNYRSTGNIDFALPIAGLFGTQVNGNAVPLQPLYGLAIQVFKGTLADPNAQLPESLAAIQDNIDLRVTLGNLLEGFIPFVEGTTATQLGTPDIAGGPYTPIDGPVDVAPLEDQVQQTIEIGYKGIISNKVLLAADAYYTRRENFVGPLLIDSPFAYLTAGQLTPALTASLTPVITSQAAGNLLVAGLLNGLGLTAEQAAALVAGLVGTNLDGLPAGIVQPDQDVLPDDVGLAAGAETVGGFLAYRNFGQLDLWGVDLSAQMLLTDDLTLFGSASFVSDDYFDDEAVGEPGTGLAVALNAPKMKFKIGGNYSTPGGLAVSLAARYVAEHPILSGPYVGDVPSYFLADVGVGYDLNSFVPGARVDLLAQNILDHMHREFVGAPKMGRFTTARVTFNF